MLWSGFVGHPQAMMLKKARGDLQLEEQEAALERKKYIEDNVKDSKVESLNKNQLLQLCEELHKQLQVAEGEKFDLEIKVKRRDLQVRAVDVGSSLVSLNTEWTVT